MCVFLCFCHNLVLVAGSVVTSLSWDGQCRMTFVANFIRFPAVQKFWKSVKIWQSYREFKGGNFFETQCSQLLVIVLCAEVASDLCRRVTVGSRSLTWNKLWVCWRIIVRNGSLTELSWVVEMNCFLSTDSGLWTMFDALLVTEQFLSVMFKTCLLYTSDAADE